MVRFLTITFSTSSNFNGGNYAGDTTTVTGPAGDKTFTLDAQTNFAAGEFTARATIDRRDENGALGKTYNQMADQLQDIIGKLEQRVADRTKELEDQSLRLRTSAEIARDAASAQKVLVTQPEMPAKERRRLVAWLGALSDKDRGLAMAYRWRMEP